MGNELEDMPKRGRGRPAKSGGHSNRVGVRLTKDEENYLSELEERYGNKKSRSEIIRIALRTLYYTQ